MAEIHCKKWMGGAYFRETSLNCYFLSVTTREMAIIDFTDGDSSEEIVHYFDINTVMSNRCFIIFNMNKTTSIDKMKWKRSL